MTQCEFTAHIIIGYADITGSVITKSIQCANELGHVNDHLILVSDN